MEKDLTKPNLNNRECGKSKLELWMETFMNQKDSMLVHFNPKQFKFRAKSITGGEGTTTFVPWVYGQYVVQPKIVMDNPPFTASMVGWSHVLVDGTYQSEVIEDTISQWSTAKDKNNTEIYGKDILSYEDKVFEVVFDQEYLSWVAKQVFGKAFSESLHTPLYKIAQDAMVIGNTIDNPELLERK